LRAWIWILKELDVEKFLDILIQFGLEFFGKFYGFYRGVVTTNKDPDGQGRIKVIVPSIGDHEIGDWAYPVTQYAGVDPDDASKKYGSFWPPEEGDGVWVAFENGNPSIPIYLGGWYARDELPLEFAADEDKSPTARGWRTKGGHRIVLDDKDGEQMITVEWSDGSNQSRLFIDKDSSVLLDVKGKHKLHLKDDELTVQLGEGAAMRVSGHDSSTLTTLGDGAVHAAIADHLESFWNSKVVPALNRWNQHVHPLPQFVAPLIPGGPSPCLPGGPPAPPTEKPVVPVNHPRYDKKITSGKLIFPDG
jgi:hypothetical protein